MKTFYADVSEFDWYSYDWVTVYVTDINIGPAKVSVNLSDGRKITIETVKGGSFIYIYNI